MSRRRLAIVIVVVAVLAAAIGAFAGGLILTDSAKPASIAGAVQRFRSTGARGGGVYLYATKGAESVDALGGAHHAYPATTTVTATGMRCGVRLRWDALAGRSTTWTLCARSGEVELDAADTIHTFFGQADRTTYACTATALLRAGPLRCRSQHGAEAGRVTVIGRETVAVGAARVSALHVRTVAQVTGGDHGTETVDWWLDPATALPVRLSLSSHTSRKTFVGRVHYAETADLRLRSLTPRR